MSSIPTKKIDGDVAVGRNVVTGGNATVRGSATVGHDLRVEGWLEARNIKGVAKGLFATEESLQTAYPKGEKGWWAIVGSGLPGDIYIWDGRKWTATGEQGGNPTIEYYQYGKDLEDIKESLTEQEESIGKAQSAVEAAQGAADAATPRQIDIGELDSMGTEGGIEALKDFVRALTYNGPAHTRWAVTTGSGRNSYLVGTLDVFSDFSRCVLTQVFETHHTFTSGVLNTNEHTDGAIRRYFRSFNIDAKSDLGVASGEWTPWQECEPESVEELRAQLNSLKAAHDTLSPFVFKNQEDIAKLKPKVEDLEGGFDGLFEPIAIGGIVSGDEIILSETSGGLSTEAGSTVVYDTTGRLLLRVATRLPEVYNYYGDWADAKDYGEVDVKSKRIVPFEKRLYREANTGCMYYWSGAGLVNLGLELGLTEHRAYPGNLGARNREDIEALTSAVTKLTELCGQLKSHAEEQQKTIEAQQGEIAKLQEQVAKLIEGGGSGGLLIGYYDAAEQALYLKDEVSLYIDHYDEEEQALYLKDVDSSMYEYDAATETLKVNGQMIPYSPTEEENINL